MTARRAVIDTCVLLPITLCDTLLHIAHRDVFVPQWTDQILTELERNLESVNGLSSAARERRISQMRRAFPHALVTGYELLIDSMRNDPHDRHVAAAAVRSETPVIVTANLKDFPAFALEPHGVSAVHPDDFLLALLESRPGEVISAVRHQCAGYRNPPIPLAALLDRLKCFTPGFVDDVTSLML